MRAKKTDTSGLQSLEEIKSMDYEKAREVILNAKAGYGITTLKRHWNISQHTLYHNLYKEYNIPFNETKGKNKKKTDKPKKAVNKPKKEIEVVEEVKELKPFFSFKLSLNGDFNGIDAEDRVLSLLATLQKEKEYNISFSIEEK